MPLALTSVGGVNSTRSSSTPPTKEGNRVVNPPCFKDEDDAPDSRAVRDFVITNIPIN